MLHLHRSVFHSYRWLPPKNVAVYKHHASLISMKNEVRCELEHRRGTPFKKSYPSTSKRKRWKRHRSMLHLLPSSSLIALFPSIHSSSYCCYFFALSVASSSSAIPFFGAQSSVSKAADCFSKVDARRVDKGLRVDSRAKLAWRESAAVFSFVYRSEERRVGKECPV